MIIRKFASLCLGLLTLTAAAQNIGYTSPNGETYRSLVFNKGDFGSQFYRIPAITTLPDGTLVAVADRRINSLNDLPGDIDIVCRRSTDGGHTWGPYITVAEHDSIGGYGDPALVRDRRTGDLLVISHEPGQICVSRSTDNGLTWQPPVNISPQLTAGKKGLKYNGAFASSGRAIQLRDGRLMFVLVTRIEGNENFPCYAIYSDDSGRTWHASRTPATASAATAYSPAQLTEASHGPPCPMTTPTSTTWPATATSSPSVTMAANTSYSRSPTAPGAITSPSTTAPTAAAHGTNPSAWHPARAPTPP